jgi:4a-hydroxytetrahydrobiopterin dehydratase
MRDFLAAMRFFDRVALLAEEEQHHPDLHLVAYRQVAIEIWTHAIGGLSENDFILAAKIDALPE